MTKPIPEPKTIFRKLMNLGRILAFLGLSSCALPHVPGEGDQLSRASKKHELSILFIGNSYSFGVPMAFKKLAESRGKNVKIGHSTYGGWSLVKHSQNPPTLKKLREWKWDIVVIQDYSLNPAMKERARGRAMDGAIHFFVNEARAIGAVPVLYQTWGRRDGDTGIAGDDFYKMNERVRRGYRSAARHCGGLIIIPAGDAWEREYQASRGKELYVEDGSHPSAFGNQVTAEVFYETIFGR